MNKDKGIGYEFIIWGNDIDVKSKTHEDPELIVLTGTQWEFAIKIMSKKRGKIFFLYCSGGGSSK